MVFKLAENFESFRVFTLFFFARSSFGGRHMINNSLIILIRFGVDYNFG